MAPIIMQNISVFKWFTDEDLVPHNKYIGLTFTRFEHTNPKAQDTEVQIQTLDKGILVNGDFQRCCREIFSHYYPIFLYDNCIELETSIVKSVAKEMKRRMSIKQRDEDDNPSSRFFLIVVIDMWVKTTQDGGTLEHPWIIDDYDEKQKILRFINLWRKKVLGIDFDAENIVLNLSKIEFALEVFYTLEDDDHNNIICSICLDPITTRGRQSLLKIKPCNHVFHSECVFSWIDKGYKNSCPNCRSKTSITIEI